MHPKNGSLLDVPFPFDEEGSGGFLVYGLSDIFMKPGEGDVRRRNGKWRLEETFVKRVLLQKQKLRLVSIQVRESLSAFGYEHTRT